MLFHTVVRILEELTYDVMLRTERIHNCLISVTSKPLDDHLMDKNI